MRIIQRCIFYSFLREITTKPHHWPCHLERSRDDKKKIVLLVLLKALLVLLRRDFGHFLTSSLRFFM